jgi:ferredoxin
MNILVVSDGKTRRLQAKKNEMLMTALLRGGLDIAHPCRGRGKCGKCKVRVVEWDGVEDMSPSNTPKAVSPKLACLVKVNRPMAVFAQSKWQKEPETKRRAPAAAGLLGDMPPVQPPCTRTCVHVPALQPMSDRSLWTHLLAAFQGKDRKSLQIGMEGVLGELPLLLAPTGGLVTLTRFGLRLLGLESGDAVGGRHGAVVMLRREVALGVLVDLRKPAIISFLGMTREKEPDAACLGRMLEGLCRQGPVSLTDVTDVVLDMDLPARARTTGLSGSPSSLEDGVPVVCEARLVAASVLGLPVARHAGVWMPPPALGREGGSLSLGTLAPYWVPVLAGLAGKAPDGGGVRLTEEDLPTLAGLLGCLLHKKIRKQADRLAMRLQSGKS